jgi:hypothetical protein
MNKKKRFNIKNLIKNLGYILKIKIYKENIIERYQLELKIIIVI